MLKHELWRWVKAQSLPHKPPSNPTSMHVRLVRAVDALSVQQRFRFPPLLTGIGRAPTTKVFCSTTQLAVTFFLYLSEFSAGLHFATVFFWFLALGGIIMTIVSTWVSRTPWLSLGLRPFRDSILYSLYLFVCGFWHLLSSALSLIVLLTDTRFLFLTLTGNTVVVVTSHHFDFGLFLVVRRITLTSGCANARGSSCRLYLGFGLRKSQMRVARRIDFTLASS